MVPKSFTKRSKTSPWFFLCCTGDIHKNWAQVVRRLKEASANATPAQLRRWSRAVDDDGDTALLLGAQRLMNCGLFNRAHQFTVMMLKYGSDVNWINNSGRSLISYAVSYMDQAIDITRLLLNSGATVWLEGKCASIVTTKWSSW